jgi:hypothetical protein
MFPVKNRAGMILWGGLSLLAGLPFLAAGISASLLTGRLSRGLPVVALLLFAVWYISGFHGAAVTAVCAVAAAFFSRSGFSLLKTIYWTTGLSILSGGLLSLAFPGFMNIGEAELEPLRDVYLSAGMESGTIDQVFSLIVHYSPGIGASQIAAGSVAAVLLYRAVCMKRNSCPGIAESARFRMHWGIAWIPIVCLAAAVYSRNSTLSPNGVRAVGNVLLFMALPYTIEGLQVAAEWAKGIPGMAVLLVISAFFATPLIAGGVLLLGILDTWFDYRTKIDNRIERMKNEGSSDKDR